MPIILAILALSILVFFHELGHFLSAKISGVKVEEFGVGYPPRIFGFYKKNSQYRFFWGKKIPEKEELHTIYSLNWIPFGGFNQLKGEAGEGASLKKEKESFMAQAWYKKAFISFSGALMNIILAFLIFSACFFYGMPQALEGGVKGRVIEKKGVQIIAVMPGSPAEKVGLKMGDVILKIDNQEVVGSEEVQGEIRKRKNEEISLTLKRGFRILEKKVRVGDASQIYPQVKESYGAIGISPVEIGIVRYSLGQSIINGFKTTFFLTGQMFYGVGLFFKSIFIEKAKIIKQIVGPVGVGAMISQAAEVGFAYFFQLLGLLSLALGVCQLIPFPALDGFRVVTSLIEGVRKKPVNPKIEAMAINFGFFFILFLMIVVTSREIIGFF
ncbi:hypothetical protein COW09_00795 [bacterium (Candidatus Moisslbacteria) CG12_big_fil_rev_8_21_14_0_65_36_11]|nr:site-2 protease family protein [Candidatus Kuenenbacteria bacterium]OIP76584.1 MAG: hypothetical protein AUK09_01350 [Parcubacteria group bacterium CG2_30_36_38]PIV46038.1 MAG: hypothetical protein COS23_01365 [bacterium (Candidatus Moisslbacteria) CG02_land_8_20_14_3_00_36_53]PIW68009.1 MAG: hypothetical protein COW09_00795 [bacterium (Candidatus Moisslbacteria) CG12_big_fil_rev_8_21_14_0_65_36_11]PIZ90405.1 MAG: hypothetical protein COX87_00740 [bacterium (Candidatus Moisslbacteria) CG_4_1